MNINILDFIIYSSLKQKISFFGWFFVIFTLTYAILVALDWLPETPSSNNSSVEASEFIEEIMVTQSVEQEITMLNQAEYPREIIIPTLKRSVTISNTTSNVVADLDADLLKGAVRHPDSVKLGEEGNVFILGHSSYLPTVFNKNFQVFNGLQDLVWGDTIVVKSDTKEYIYQVKKVYKAKASALTVPVTVDGQRLTLATCNSFGSVDDRYIVEAELVSTKPLAQ